MTVNESESGSKIVHPARPLHRKYVEPILYLADKMAHADGKAVPRERKVVDELAQRANLKGFRHERWFRELDDAKACQAITVDAARQGALVVLSLVLKADEDRKSTEHQYFTEVRNMIGGDAVTVPVDFEEHKTLAMEYIGG